VEELQLITRKNCFNAKDKEISYIPYENISLSEIRDKYLSKDIAFHHSVNGKVMSETYVPNPDDCIVFTPIIEGGGNVMRSLAMIIIVAIATYYAGPAGAAIGESMAGAGASAALGGSIAPAAMMTAELIGYNIGFAIASVATMTIGGMLVNSMFPMATPDASSGALSTSQTFSWNPVTTQSQGIVKPRIYGEIQTYGNIIATYVDSIVMLAADVTALEQYHMVLTEDSADSKEVKNYLNVLVSLGLGPLSDISDIYLNDQPKTLYNDVIVEVRKGLLDQTVITNFNDTKVEYDINRLVKCDSPIVYRTEGNSFDEIEVNVSFPRGCYSINQYGSYASHTIQYKIELRNVTNPSEIILLTGYATNYAEDTTNVARWVKLKNISNSGGYQNNPVVELGSIVRTDHNEGESIWEWVAIPGYDYNGVLQPGYYQEYFWTWANPGSNYTYSGAPTTQDASYFEYIGPNSNAISFTHKSKIITKGKYDVIVTKVNADINTPTTADTVVFASIKEVYNDDFEYPREALVGIKALASNQLSGSLSFSCLVKGLYVRVYNGSTWAVENAYTTNTHYNNPAWVCYDVLTQPVFDNNFNILRYDGIDPAFIDTNSFYTWAQFCDELVSDGNGGTEKRFTFNGSFDTEMSIWDAAVKICLMSRASIFPNGNQFKIVVDKAETAGQLFSTANISVDSFEEVFLPMEERAGEIEVSFINKDKNYDKDIITIVNTDIDRPSNKVSLQLLGTTSWSQAWRSGQFFLLSNQYLKRKIKFDADVDAIACEMGDVINFQHDVPSWGLAGGLIVSATTSSITLDQEVTIEAGKTYSILVRRSDSDTVITKVISNTPGEYSVLNVTTNFTDVPEVDDIYAFGESTIAVKPLRVLTIEQSSDSQVVLNCIEYDSNIYTVDTGTPVVPTTNYSYFPKVSPVTTLTSTEEIYYDETGNVKRDIIVHFNIPGNPYYKCANIYYRKNSVNGQIICAGTTITTTFRLQNVSPNTTYIIYVESISYPDIALDSFDWPTSTIITSTNLPTVQTLEDIKGLEIFGQGNNYAFTGKNCKIAWKAPSSVVVASADTEIAGAGSTTTASWVKDYKVVIYNIDGTVRRIEYVTDISYNYTYAVNLEDGNATAVSTFIVGVVVRDFYGNASAKEAKITVVNSTPILITGITAESVFNGALFSWDKNTEEDFQCYYVRTKVGTGSYSDWVKVTDNKYNRYLTNAEVTLYTNHCTIYCDVKSMDLFEQLSSLVTSSVIVTDVNVFQLGITVDGEGSYTGIQSSLYDGNESSGGVVIV